MPKYVGPDYNILKYTLHLNCLIDAYLLLKNYGISEKDMRNILNIYTTGYKKAPIKAEVISSILNNNSILKEDKVYYIYAKLYSLTEENDNIEKDMINAYQIMKKYPKIFKKDSDNSTLGDDVFWVLRFYRQKCKTAEMLNIVLSDSNIKDEDKLFRTLGKLKVLSLKDDVIEANKNYPPILFKMADEGRPLIIYFWQNEAHKYYENEQVLQDVYNAYKLLMQAKIDDLSGDDNETSILTLHPELCKAEEITKKVLSDPKIAPKDKAKMIGRKIEKEYYNQKDKISEAANTAIELGIVPKYITNFYYITNRYNQDLMANNIKAYELMKKNPAFKDKYIAFFMEKNCPNSGFDLYESVKKVIDNKTILDKDKPMQVFREFLLTRNNNNSVKLFDAGIISLENDLYEDIFDFDRGDEETQRIINSYKAMKQAGFRENDIVDTIYELYHINNYLEQSIKAVISDTSIEKDDKFIFSCANTKKQSFMDKIGMPVSYYKAVDKNIIPLYYNDYTVKDERFYEQLIETVNFMKNNLGYKGYEIYEIFLLTKKVDDQKMLNSIRRILNNNSLSKNDKINKIKKEHQKILSQESFKNTVQEVKNTVQEVKNTVDTILSIFNFRAFKK